MTQQSQSTLSRVGLDTFRRAPQSAQRSSEQEQTREAFGFKWAKRDTYESPAVKENMRRWLFERYCGNDPKLLDHWLAGDRKVIVDAGCGAGFSGMLFFGDHLKRHDYIGVDISNSVTVAEQRFREAGYPGEFFQSSLLELPLKDASVDMIFSEGVLHHTDSTRNSVIHLARKLKPGGLFLFYVYVKKAVIREFTDDHIREAIRGMDDETAWEALKPLTKLGKTLGDLGVTIKIDEDIPFLGIKKGELDLQRFFYWNICKLYYRPEFNLDEMHHINFDWFRPLNCHRHTPEEVKEFCQAAGLDILRLDVQEAGITVVGRKK